MFFELFVIFLISIAIYFYNYLYKTYKHWETRGIKYAKPTPILGNLTPTLLKHESSTDFVRNLYKLYPDESYFGIFQFLTPTLIVRDPGLIKQITIKNFENFVDHPNFTDPEADPMFSKNLFSSKGEKWRDLRQTLSPFFTGSKMRMMFNLMEDCALRFVDHYKKQPGTVIKVEMKEAVAKLTNDVIANTAFGVECDSFKSPDNEFYISGRYMSSQTGLKRLLFLISGNLPWLARLLKLKITTDKIDDFFKSVIDESLKLREEKNIIRPDLIHLLMLARKGKLKLEEECNVAETGFAVAREFQASKISKDLLLSIEDITAQAMVFFLGGFDTVSTTACFACYELALNPQIQNRLRDEIRELNENLMGKISYEDIAKMKYLDMVLSEVLRKWPPGIFLDRKCTKSCTIQTESGDNLKFELGDIVWIPVCGIHYDAKYYSNPELFDPERFSEENKEKILPCTYLPFGTGPRNCIGSRFALLEMKIFLFHVLLNFEIVTTDKTAPIIRPSKDNFFLTAEGGFQLGLKKIV